MVKAVGTGDDGGCWLSVIGYWCSVFGVRLGGVGVW